MLPDSIEAMVEVSRKIGIPIATGERLHTIHEFEALLSRGAVRYVRPDVCLVGGITHAKKIAALAEAQYAGVVPHNPGGLSPVGTAACLQLSASIPNFVIQGYPATEYESPKKDIAKNGPLTHKNGFLVIPDRSGIGVELADDAAEKFPPKTREIVTRLHVDGSVVDQ